VCVSAAAAEQAGLGSSVEGCVWRGHGSCDDADDVTIDGVRALSPTEPGRQRVGARLQSKRLVIEAPWLVHGGLGGSIR
jgi:hypothetical protein